MAEIKDPRLREMAFLARLEREGFTPVTSKELFEDGPLKAMALHLLQEGYVNGLDTVSWSASDGEAGPMLNFGGKTQVQLKHEGQVAVEIARALANQEVRLRISHKGRVRRSELEQALRTGRDREPFGILWAERHRDQAVAMAVLTAGPKAPVSLSYMDMNGLKRINDENSHNAGDEAIKAYLRTIAMLTGDAAEAFRSGGADEVVVVMRSTSTEQARTSMRAVLRQLRKECVHADGKRVVPFLTASCGIVTTTDPATDASALVKRADAEQKRAKLASKEAPGESFLAVEGQDAVEKVTLGDA